MRQLLFAFGLPFAAVQAVAQPTFPFGPGEGLNAQLSSQASPRATSCSFADKNLPADTIVVAAGAYSGRTVTFQIDESGHEATQFDIAIHADKPVALLLAAYEPSIWNIGWTKGTKVVAVFATGYHRQVVAGLPKDTPVITSSYQDKGPCGYAYMSDSLGWVNPKSRSVFGKEAVRVYNKAPGGIIDIGESQREKSNYVTVPDVKPESFRDRTAPLAGTAGLNEAVSKGLIRPMTSADIQSVKEHYQVQAAKNATGKADIPPVAGASPSDGPAVRIPSLSTYRGYVVLKPFVFPAGLYGGNLAYFIVPKGAPAPTGNPGHSTVINLNRSAACTGPSCASE